MEEIDEILQFWFRGIDDETVLEANKWPMKMWFMKDQKVDDQIREKYEGDIKKGACGEYKTWEENIRGRLALILLFDQFARNIYRNTVKMFAFDEKALALTLKSIDQNKDKELKLIERVFLYLPLEHSEDIGMQELSLKYFQSLVDESKKIYPRNTGYYEYTFSYAQRHYDVIKQFGRFPHRNAILNRASTKEEEEFLKKPGSSF